MPSGVPSASLRSFNETDMSNLAVFSVTRTRVVSQPSRTIGLLGWLLNESITWKSGCLASVRAGLSISTR